MLSSDSIKTMLMLRREMRNGTHTHTHTEREREREKKRLERKKTSVYGCAALREHPHAAESNE